MLYLKLKIWTLCGVRCCLGKLFTVYLVLKKLDLNMCLIDLGQIDETYTVPRLLELCAFKLVVLVTSQRSIRLYTLLPCELVNACRRPEDKMITSVHHIVPLCASNKITVTDPFSSPAGVDSATMMANWMAAIFANSARQFPSLRHISVAAETNLIISAPKCHHFHRMRPTYRTLFYRHMQ